MGRFSKGCASANQAPWAERVADHRPAALTGVCVLVGGSHAASRTGKATTSGMCGINGADPAGFSLTLDGAVGLVRTCPTRPVQTVQVLLTGRVAVAAPPS
jgi:hypothetical protein